MATSNEGRKCYSVKAALNGRPLPVGRANAITVAPGIRVFKYGPGEREAKIQESRLKQIKRIGYYYYRGVAYNPDGTLRMASDNS